ncbi:haloacid dehalogenase-like hydrolase [Shewanella sp. VB17]|uniref:HAD family hydrolase n=1 Tax=Shewanella sp. VB17 TaxID=2739432 RepID=UPI001564ADED|nr:HAD family hydrolase [Shewanella sp. VB17]NRD72869.1 haloacid dehalogenase-like hydrolase [Shewanella sp. VB17]
MDRHVVIFDFDQTMVLENSLGFLFKQLSGPYYWLNAVPVVIKSLLTFTFGYKLRRAVKQCLYSKILTGMTVNDIQVTGKMASAALTSNQPIIDRLIEATNRGNFVIVATASPQVYIASIVNAMGLNVDLVIGTHIDLTRGIVIGQECSRVAKWIAVKEQLNKLSLLSTTAYGNQPDDVHMLEQVDHGFIVTAGSIVQHHII